jgi:hypothetical protein
VSIGIIKKRDKESKDKDSGGEASANYMITQAPGEKGRNNTEGGRETTTTQGRIADKPKEEVKDTKVIGIAEKAADSTKKSIAPPLTNDTTTTLNDQGRRYEEGADGTTKTTTFERTKDSPKEYDEKEPMSSAKIKEHEPTVVRRDTSVELGQESASAEDAEEKARVSAVTTTTARELPEKQRITSMPQSGEISAAQQEEAQPTVEKITTTASEVSSYQQQREQQQSINRALNETRDNIRRSVDEARREIPHYTQAVNEYQEQSLQASREIADNYIESQKQIINSLQSAWVPQIETVNKIFTSYWISPRHLTEIYANMISNAADNMITATRLLNNMMFASMNAFRTLMQQSKDNAKEFSRIGVNTAKTFEQTSRNINTAKLADDNYSSDTTNTSG